MAIDVVVIDPLGLFTVTAGRDNCFRTCCPLVRASTPHFSNLADCGLAEWIIDVVVIVFASPLNFQYLLREKRQINRQAIINQVEL